MRLNIEKGNVYKAEERFKLHLLHAIAIVTCKWERGCMQLGKLRLLLWSFFTEAFVDSQWILAAKEDSM